jgi:hypothetical protein
MQFLVALRDLAVLVDPDERVLDFGIRAGLVDTDVDREFMFFRGFLQAEDEGGGAGGLAEGGWADVVGGFGDEEGGCIGGGGFLDEELALGEVVGEGGGGADLADCLVVCECVMEKR